jgi:hypothetical protein
MIQNLQNNEKNKLKIIVLAIALAKSGTILSVVSEITRQQKI